MRKILLSVGLWVVVVASFLEIFFYFIYIYKPLDRLAGRDVGTPREIPSVSDLFTPILLSDNVTKANETKTFYPDKVNNFIEILKAIMPSKSSFVKAAEVNYVVADEVFESKVGANGYEVTLKNNVGDEHKEYLNSSEMQYAKVFLRTTSPRGFSRDLGAFSDIKKGDYMVIKRTTNLLTVGDKVDIEIEILRTIK